MVMVNGYMMLACPSIWLSWPRPSCTSGKAGRDGGRQKVIERGERDRKGHIEVLVDGGVGCLAGGMVCLGAVWCRAVCLVGMVACGLMGSSGPCLVLCALCWQG